MSLLVKNNRNILKNAQISYKSNWYWSQFSILKGNLIKVTHITQSEAVSLPQKLLFVAEVASMQTVWVT